MFHITRSQLRRLGAAVAIATLPVASVACSDDSSGSAAEQGTDASPGQESAAASLALKATVIDVRTPEEFSAGHVDGAQLIDVQGSSFDADIAKLDPATTYVVYCRSGNRSATAATRMRDAGLTVFDGGAMDAMVAAGWPTA